MSQSHKGSRLLIQDVVYAVPFESAHFNFNHDEMGIGNGELIKPLTGSVYTMNPLEGKFGGGVAIDEYTYNYQADRPLNAYNNYATDKQAVASISVLSEETLFGSPIYRLSYQPISGTAVASVQTEYWKHGIHLAMGTTLTSGNTFMSSIYWRTSKSDVSVSGIPSNIGGWIEKGTRQQANGGWNRSFMAWSGNADRTDNKYWGFKSPSAQANEVIVIDWACPQLEKKTFATSFVNGARDYEGLLSYPRELFNPSSFTVNMWVKWGHLHERYNSLFGCNTDSSNRFLWMLDLQANGKKLAIWANRPNGSLYNTSSHVPDVGKWYMYTVTFDGAKYRQFVNGELVGSVDSTLITTPSNTATLSVGSSIHGAGNGFFDEVLILPKSVEDEEVYSWFIAGTPFYNPFDYRGYAY